MMVGNPIWLWGFVGLVIPIGIHLLSRKEGKVIRFGSLRHLQETPTQQFKHLRLNDVWQLLLRCLIVITLVLALADIRLPSAKGQKWVVLEPTATLPITLEAWVDSLKDNGFELRSFRSGFPLLNEETYEPTSTSYWKLIQELNSIALERAYIISPAPFNRFTGARIPLAGFISWIPLEPANVNFVQDVTKISNDSVLVTAGASNALITQFSSSVQMLPWQQTHVNDSLSIQLKDTVTVALFYDDAYVNTARILKAALNTIGAQANFFLTLSINQMPKNPSDSSWLIWLSSRTPVAYGKNKLLLREQPYADLLAQESAHRWTLSRAVTEEDILRDHLLTELATLILKPVTEEPRFDLRGMPETMLKAPAITTEKKSPAGYHPIENILMVLLILFVAAERIIAYLRNA